MEKEQLRKVINLAQELIDAPTCSEEARAAAKAWLASEGNDAEETTLFIQELKQDIVTVDDLIAFSASPEGAAHFGEELASSILAHGKELKAAGVCYCDCPACTAALAILAELDPS